MASTYLSKTFSGNGSATIHTISAWIKKSSDMNTTTPEKIFFAGSGSNQHQLYFTNFDASGSSYDDAIQYEFYNGSQNYYIRTNRSFRDPSAWYHIVVVWDTTQSTASDRIKLYVNGVQETSFQGSAYPTQNFAGFFGQSTYAHRIGGSDSGQYFNGLMTHFHYIDGTAYTPSTFGETDSTSGIWKPKTAPSVTYGTNGFFLKFENSGAMGTDSSGNSNTFAVGGGTLTQNVDTPSNVFATLNPVYPYTSTGAITNGNTVPSDYAAYQGIVGTLGASSGKYYFEVKINGSSGERGMVGWGARDTGQITFPGGGAYDYGRLNNAGTYYNNGSDTAISGASAYTTNDICGCAIDLDGNKIYWYKNGALENSGGTTITASSTAGNYFPIVRNGDGNNIQCNFGSGFFGTTAVASANADANGFGAFEYAVPSGYYALCTKNIKEFG